MEIRLGSFRILDADTVVVFCSRVFVTDVKDVVTGMIGPRTVNAHEQVKVPRDRAGSLDAIADVFRERYPDATVEWDVVGDNTRG